LSVKPGL